MYNLTRISWVEIAAHKWLKLFQSLLIGLPSGDKQQPQYLVEGIQNPAHPPYLLDLVRTSRSPQQNYHKSSLKTLFMIL